MRSSNARDSSLRLDRGLKLRVYAKSGVAEYWIVNLQARQVEVHRNPHDLGYATVDIAKPGDTIRFSAFPDCPFAVDELLGPPPAITTGERP